MKRITFLTSVVLAVGIMSGMAMANVATLDLNSPTIIGPAADYGAVLTEVSAEIETFGIVAVITKFTELTSLVVDASVMFWSILFSVVICVGLFAMSRAVGGQPFRYSKPL